MNRISWLDDLGRKSRSRSDTQMENIIGHLSKLAVEHEVDDHGKNRWHLATKATAAEEDD